MIALQDVSYRYAGGDFELRVGALAVEAGQAVAVVGSSGSGKTTLLHMLAGVTVPQSGRVVVNDVDLTELSQRARRRFRIANVGMVFQEFELLDYLRVRDNILLPYRIHPCLKLDKAVRARAAGLAERTGIGGKLNRLAGQLSHGEKQRVAVCRSLLTGPSVILADEPTGNLDPANTRRVLDILLDYTADAGATMLTVTHDHDLLARFGRVIDMQDMRYFAPPVACRKGAA